MSFENIYGNDNHNEEVSGHAGHYLSVRNTYAGGDSGAGSPYQLISTRIARGTSGMHAPHYLPRAHVIGASRYGQVGWGDSPAEYDPRIRRN
jgi:hypothetical protein